MAGALPKPRRPIPCSSQLPREEIPALSSSVRWARTRLRLPVWPLVLWEPVIGWAASGAAGAAALVCAGAGVGVVVAGLVVHTAAWLAGEKWFMTGRGLAFGPRAAAAAMLREALAPALMAGALGSRAIYWRGTNFGGHWSARGDNTAEKSV